MAKGKYAARAANRLAEIDSVLVAELREKVARLTAERDEALATLEAERRDRATDAQRIGAELSAEAIQELQTALADSKQQREQDRLKFCEQVFDVLNEYGVALPTPADWLRFAEIFGRNDLGVLLGKYRRDNNRHARRSSAAKIRMTSDLIRRGVL